MTGGLGFTTLMEDLYKQNRDLLKHTNRFINKKENLKYKALKGKYTFKEATPEVMREIRAQAKRRNIKDRLIISFVFSLVLTALILLAVYVCVNSIFTICL
jgi:hypothetical protein